MVRCAKAEPVERTEQCRLPLDSGRKRVEHMGLACSDWLRLWWDFAVTFPLSLGVFEPQVDIDDI